jgi:hypothetical protein
LGEELEDLNFEEFKNLSDIEKWNLIQTIKKILTELKIRADKNCEEC